MLSCLVMSHICELNRPGNLKLDHVVIYENSSDELDIGHCPIHIIATLRLAEIFVVDVLIFRLRDLISQAKNMLDN